MKIPLLGMEMVKLKQDVEAWVPPCLFTYCKIPILFLIFENISTKTNGRRVDILHMNVNMYVICRNFLNLSCNLMFCEPEVAKKMPPKTSLN